MARSQGRPAKPKGQRDAEEPAARAATPPEPAGNQVSTGGGARYLFLLREGTIDEAIRLIQSRTGLAFTTTADAPEGPFALDQPGSSGLVLDKLGVAIATLVPDQVAHFDDLDKDGPI